MVKAFYCWDCKRTLHKKEVTETKNGWICRRCKNEAVDPIEIVDKALIQNQT
jgi:ribosomal protein L37AE/L43A